LKTGAAESKHSESLRKSLQEGESKESALLATAEYLTDERSGDEVTDSEKEFEDIVELDNILKSILESTLEVNELHGKISALFTKMRQLIELIEFESADIKDICENIVSRELLFFTSFASIVKIAETAYFI
jgi:chromatin remodeling complex protein RSC6